MSTAKNRKRLGERLVTEFAEFRDHLRNGEIDKKYTVRTVELDNHVYLSEPTWAERCEDYV
jgi:hypothetical protein